MRVLEKPADAALARTAASPTRSMKRDPASPADPLIGTVLAKRYRIIELIGQGGMGRVYRAEHQELGKEVAVKVLPAHFAERGDAVQRFIQEAKTASQVGHENIVDVNDLGKTREGMPFFVMEYLRGKDLQTVLNDERPLRWDERTRDIFAQICSALAAAHDRGIIHRDMKPENVFLIERRDRKEFVKILDFGIAKLRAETPSEKKSEEPTRTPEASAGRRHLTRDGTVLGTVFYMAPEQGLGKEIDQRADIYAVGVMLYEMLTGYLPFDIPNETKMDSDAIVKILEMHLNEPAVPPRTRRPEANIPEEVEAIVMKALEKDPAARFGNMGDMEAALLRCAAPKYKPRFGMSLDETEQTRRSLEGLLRIRKEEAGRGRRAKIRNAIIGALLAAGAGAAIAGSVFSSADPAVEDISTSAQDDAQGTQGSGAETD